MQAKRVKTWRMSGFTLIELLAVIAITGVMASLLLPVLHKAKALASATHCASNLHQLQFAWQLYADDHNGALVPNYETGIDGNYLTVCSTPESWVSGSALANAGVESIRQGALWNHTRSEQVYRCPSDKSRWLYGNRSHRAPRPFNVGLSVWMNGGWNGQNGKQLASWGPSVIVKSGELMHPANLFTFIDEDAGTMTSGAFWVNPAPTTDWWMFPGTRDRGTGANVAFADGHVEFHPWNYTNRVVTGWPTPATKVSDKADLAWLAARVP